MSILSFCEKSSASKFPFGSITKHPPAKLMPNPFEPIKLQDAMNTELSYALAVKYFNQICFLSPTLSGDAKGVNIISAPFKDWIVEI